MKYFLIILTIFVACGNCLGQQLQSIEGVPTKEIYDLKLDHKGYLWVAHDLGISRFDGISFTHYNNEHQSSLSMTDITEDAEGRIWCHNFTGQVFYIENQRMKLFESYNFKKERQFPRLVLCNEQVLITSESGLYAVDTKTLKSTFYSFPETYNNITVSISVIGKKAVVYNRHSWFIYEKKNGLKRIEVDTAVVMDKTNVMYLQPYTFHDTIFLISNPLGLLQRLKYVNNEIKLVSKETLGDFINDVSVLNNDVWINTRSWSKTIDGKNIIAGENISDIVEDKDGNMWYSSLEKGLLVKYKKSSWEIVDLQMANDDYARCITTINNHFFIGSQKGQLFLLDSSMSNYTWKHHFSYGNGAIENISKMDDDNIFIASSINSFVLHLTTKIIDTLHSVNTFKNVDFVNDGTFLAAPNGLFIKPKDIKDYNAWAIRWKKKLPYFTIYNSGDKIFLIYQQRCKAVIYDKNDNIVLSAFKDGLFKLGKDSLEPFMYNNAQVMATSLEYHKGVLYIGTLNNGLLAYNNGKIKNISTKDYLNSNTIVKLKVINDHLWVFENNSIQLFDCLSQVVLDNIKLPELLGSEVFDVIEKRDFAYLTTNQGIYKIKLQEEPTSKINAYLDYVLVNGTDTLTATNASLKFRQNDIQFNFSTPPYFESKELVFKYRLAGANDEQWHTTKTYERWIRFASLMPGQYKFEFVATYSNHISSSKPVFFDFSIAKPWWNEWWFYFLVFLFITLGFFSVYRYRLRHILKIERLRRKISSDLHDDIGATLSSINIYTELARKEQDKNVYINLIEAHSTEAIEKLDDLVWSINPNNDTIEQLIQRMKLFAEPILHASGIHCNFKYNNDILKLPLSIETKSDIFLIFKELINNVVKHSKASYCNILLSRVTKCFSMEVTDNGVGFIIDQKTTRNGIKNIYQRADRLNSEITIDSTLNNGTTVCISIPC